MHTTNYSNTFIEVAEDSLAEEAEIPPLRGNAKTAARIQYEMISEHPYRYTSDDVLFETHAIRKNIPETDKLQERNIFFSKGQPCLRASALTKRYGWGVHSDANGKIAIYAVESDEYRRLTNDDSLKKIKAMRSKRS